MSNSIFPTDKIEARIKYLKANPGLIKELLLEDPSNANKNFKKYLKQFAKEERSRSIDRLSAMAYALLCSDDKPIKESDYPNRITNKELLEELKNFSPVKKK